MGGVRVIERSDYLVDFLRERGFHEMRKARHEYLSYYGFDQEYVFVLVEGVVKASVTLREGTRFNISYIKGPSPVSLLRDEVSSRAKSPYSVRVESPEAIYMAVPRVRFWEFVNEDSRLLGYVKDYYRASLEESLYRMRYLTMNGKVGAVGGFLYDLNERFGVPCDEGSSGAGRCPPRTGSTGSWPRRQTWARAASRAAGRTRRRRAGCPARCRTAPRTGPA